VNLNAVRTIEGTPTLVAAIEQAEAVRFDFITKLTGEVETQIGAPPRYLLRHFISSAVRARVFSFEFP